MTNEEMRKCWTEICPNITDLILSLIRNSRQVFEKRLDVVWTVVADLACSTSPKPKTRSLSRMVVRVTHITHGTMRPMQSGRGSGTVVAQRLWVSGLPIFYAFHMSRSRNCYRSTLLSRPDVIILGRGKTGRFHKEDEPGDGKKGGKRAQLIGRFHPHRTGAKRALRQY